MFVNFNEEVRYLLKQAEKEKDDLNHPYVGSEHLFLSILKNSKLKNLFKKNKLTYEIFKNKLINIVGVGTKKSPFILYTPLLKRVLEDSIIMAKEENEKIVGENVIILSLLDEKDGIAYSILKSLSINVDKLYYDLKRINYDRNNRHKKTTLEDIGTNLNKLAKENKLDPVIGRDKEITSVIEILLRRKKNNPILIGPAGVGKTAIVEAIANLIIKKDCPYYLKNKKIVSLNIFSLVSGTKYRGEFEEKMKTIIKELEENDDIILFIDEIHTIVGAGGAEGAIDASNILKPALARGKIKIIGATTLDEYKKYIEPDTALARRFQNIIINEPSLDNVIKILNKIKPLYEKYHNIKIDKNLIKEIVYLSDKYLTNRNEPDRSIDILDEVCVRAGFKETKEEKYEKKLLKELKIIKNNKLKAIENKDFSLACKLKSDEKDILKKISLIKTEKKKVTKEDILQVIKNKGNINIHNNKMMLYYDEIKEQLKSKLTNKEDIINKLILSLKRKEIQSKKKCYSILIEGESGVGKTYLAKQYLSCFTNKKNIIDIDLSEYKDYHTISKLIGTTAGYLGYDNKNNIFEKVRTNPSSYIIVDNFDEGCFEVQNIFIKILENNKIQDAKGVNIDFSNTMIIFTLKSSENSDGLGFNSKSKNDTDDIDIKIKSLVELSINLKKPKKEDTKLLIIDKINNIIKKYNINVIYDSKYIDYVYENTSNNLLLVDKFLNENVENNIIDAIINSKNNLILKKTSKVI